MDSRKDSLSFRQSEVGIMTRQGKDMSEGKQEVAQCRRGCVESQQGGQEAACLPLVPFNSYSFFVFFGLNVYVSLLVPSSLTFQCPVKHVFISCNLQVLGFFFSSAMRSHNTYCIGFERISY